MSYERWEKRNQAKKIVRDAKVNAEERWRKVYIRRRKSVE